MIHRAQQFRVRYVGPWGTVHEVEIAAFDTDEAIRVAREARWPPRAVGFRLIDTEGREVFEQLKSDLRNG
jgi:hypothetical protein